MSKEKTTKDNIIYLHDKYPEKFPNHNKGSIDFNTKEKILDKAILETFLDLMYLVFKKFNIL